ncbi:YolD-like family protein [Caldibacillus debilis]|uniref:YolD-like family protein n=1 Tax=Caldibacillus debilis TaxID=301148 RepID=A0A150M6C5_9BACI|nr:YolD-like family protein [Caldibacillus debilis]KYD20160.1 hypothetical protein B4135_1935 [Caldibacillus debilis]
MIRDRGRIKWTSLMLPEHVKMLREWAEEEKWEEEKTADEQAREEWDGILSQAVGSRRKVRVNYFRNRRYEMLTGVVRRSDPLARTIELEAEGKTIVLEREKIAGIDWE